MSFPFLCLPAWPINLGTLVNKIGPAAICQYQWMYFEKDFPGGAIQEKTITPIGAAVTAAVCKSYYCNSLQEHNTEQRGRWRWAHESDFDSEREWLKYLYLNIKWINIYVAVMIQFTIMRNCSRHIGVLRRCRSFISSQASLLPGLCGTFSDQE